jgi:hypothetical protein
MRRAITLLGLGAAALVAACAEQVKTSLGPENDLLVTNQADTFALGVNDLKNVYTELDYTWRNNLTRARIFHCSFLPHGESRLLLLDAAGDTVYDRPLLYRLEGLSDSGGRPGNWSIHVAFYGSVGSWADFVLDATSDTAPSGLAIKDVCEARGR